VFASTKALPAESLESDVRAVLVEKLALSRLDSSAFGSLV